MEALALIVAIGPNGLIGKGGQVPWRVPEDMKHFRRVTTGHAIIMGRKTFDEVGKPLPERRNIVVSRTRGLELPGALVVASVEEAITRARETDPEPFVIGGAEIYRLAMPYVTRVFLTEISGVPEDGDTYFPPFDRAVWEEVERRKGEDPRATYVVLTRKAPSPS